MNDINVEIGLRLREVRHIINEGGKLSADQFAHLLNETRDRIINYELGRASVPIRILYELYKRGINPIYIIAGDGSPFAENEAGQRLSELINEKAANIGKRIGKTIVVGNAELQSQDEAGSANVLKVAAGLIKRKDDKK